MSRGSMRQPRVHLAPPQFMGRVFQCDRVNELIIGDSALHVAAMLEAFIYFGEREGLARLDFWGRAASFHADRAHEILRGRPYAPEVNAYTRFDQIDLLEDAERIARTAIGTFVILDPHDVLESRLIDALQNETTVAAVS